MDRRRIESYQSLLTRLFPRGEPEPARIGGPHVMNVTMQITEDCNLRCSYCFIREKRHNVMSFETAKKFIDLLLDADGRVNRYVDSRHSDGVILELIGGEPLTEIDLLTRVSDYFVEQLFVREHPWAARFRISLCSNGLNYFDPRFQEYLRRHRAHLSFNVSVDGSRELHDACRVDRDGNGSYDRAIAAMRHYVEHWGGSFSSKMTIAPGNVDKLGDAVKAMLETGYREINLNCVYEKGWTLDHARTLYRQLKAAADAILDNGLYETVWLSILREETGHPLAETDNRNWCGGNGLMLCVDWNGTMYPCYRYTDSAMNGKRPRYSIGTVDRGIGQTREERERIRCLGCITRRSQSTDECFHCPIAQGCSWCTAYNYECAGTPDKRATYICDMHKARTLACAYYHNRGYRLTGRKKRFAMDIPRDWALQIISEQEYESLLSLAND